MLTLSVTNKTEKKIPDALLIALDRAQHRLEYTAVRDLFSLVEAWDEIVGVFGDGANGSYEWFRFWSKTGRLETSNAGYGNWYSPLRDVLNLSEKDDSLT